MFKICCKCKRFIFTCMNQYISFRKDNEINYLHQKCYDDLYKVSEIILKNKKYID